MKRLDGKVIVVAGAGGIGDELALRFATEGAAVVVGDLDGGAARRVASEITAAGHRAVGVDFDGGDDASVAALVARAIAEFGGLDGFHANFASFQDTGGDVLAMPMEDYDETMRVSTRGYVLCTRQALPALLARGGGALILPLFLGHLDKRGYYRYPR